MSSHHVDVLIFLVHLAYSDNVIWISDRTMSMKYDLRSMSYRFLTYIYLYRYGLSHIGFGYRNPSYKLVVASSSLRLVWPTTVRLVSKHYKSAEQRGLACMFRKSAWPSAASSCRTPGLRSLQSANAGTQPRTPMWITFGSPWLELIMDRMCLHIGRAQPLVSRRFIPASEFVQLFGQYCARVSCEGGPSSALSTWK
jgi:hypothetical protein